MKISKKLLMAAALSAMVLLSCVPATFSWYSHSKEYNGTKLNVSEDNFPVSVKSAADCVSYATYISNEKGEATSTAANYINVTPAEKVKYYKTTFTNSGTNDVMVDLETLNLPNNADFSIGTVSPTINEKAYASRAVRNKVSDNTVRVYFRPVNDFKAYWGTYVTGDVTFNTGITNDMNIAYRLSGDSSDTYKKLNLCGTSYNSSTPANYYFYYDVPSNIDYFYFFNHWYIASDSNKEWNRTINITDITPGRLYYLTGQKVDEKYKEYAVSAVDTDLVAVNQYYSSVRMSHGTGVFSDITLHKTGDDENFIPEYYGSSIAYSSSNTTVAQVNKDGIITPVGYGIATITTTITGKYGDTRQVTTTLEIPQQISHVPIIKNVRVPAGESVAVDWYALNKSTEDTMTTTAFLFTT